MHFNKTPEQQQTQIARQIRRAGRKRGPGLWTVRRLVPTILYTSFRTWESARAYRNVLGQGAELLPREAS